MGHGGSKAIGLATIEPGTDPGQLHQLFLEDRNPQRLFEDRHRRRVGIAHRLLPVAPAQVGMHRLALDRAGSDERHLHRQVVEGLRLHLGKRRHLRARLHLEEPHRVCDGELTVDGGFLGDGSQIDPDPVRLLDEIRRQVEGVEHPQSEEVELHDPDGGAVVFVPLEHRSAFHPPPFDRHHLVQRSVGDDHPPRMDPQVTRKPVETVTHVVDQLGGQPVRERCLGAEMVRPARVDVPGKPVDLGLGHPEHLAHVAQHRSRPVGDDIGDHGRPLPPVSPVAVLDHLFPAVGLQIQVDVRRPSPLFGEEPLERQVQPDRIDPGEADAPAHRRVGTRTADLAVDVLGAGEVDDVFDHEEVPGEPEPVDDPQLVLEPLAGPRVDSALSCARVHLSRPFEGEVTEILHLAAEVPRHGERRKVGTDQSQIEGESLPQRRSPTHHSRVAGEPSMLLIRRLEEPLVGARPKSVRFDQVTATGDGGEHVCQMGIAAHGVVDLVGGDRRDAQPLGHLPQQIVAVIVPGHAVMPQLDVEPRPEQLSQPASLGDGCGDVTTPRRPRHRPLPAAGETEQVGVSCRLGQVAPGVRGPVLLTPELGSGHQPGEGGIGSR